MSDKKYKYIYGQKIMNPEVISPLIKNILEMINKKLNKNYDSILINYYSDGNIGMRYHSDSVYGEWYEDSVVISFGSEREIIFREIDNYSNKIKFIMESGDLLFMKEGCQKLYQHKVSKNRNITLDRISLVFKRHK